MCSCGSACHCADRAGRAGTFYKKADTSAGLEYIHGEEKGDIAAIEKKIELLEKKTEKKAPGNGV
ncbi:hypothetical protein M5E84_08095 [[Ruminococcus] torques]|nr:hypothetical protein M5E84_08095 [[Ruminococcus] torques]